MPARRRRSTYQKRFVLEALERQALIYEDAKRELEAAKVGLELSERTLAFTQRMLESLL